MSFPKITRRIKIGLALIYLAGLGWLAEFIIPFTKIAHKGLIWTIVLIAAEVMFVAGVAVLGKSLYRQLKQQLLDYIRNNRLS
jgi:biotin transporter BioY